MNGMNNVKKRIILSGMFLLVFFLLPPLLAASSGVTQFASIGTRPAEMMVPNGDFSVSVLKGGKWEEVGKLSFDRFVRERKLDLGACLPADGPARVRITQHGGGAAHLDALFLGGNPPVEVNGAREEKTLRKLEKKDADLIDAFGKSFELLFPDAKEKVLTIAARVEPEVIGKTPFLIPSRNYCKDMNSDFSYYPYKLRSGKSENRRNWPKKPFISQLLHAGSGHPSSLLYGYVSNDEKNLFVTLDFTGDNTMDGDKDYTKVFVRTGWGVKEFKITESEKKWGKAFFTYTDKVPYEHKVYKYRIPLTEVGVKDVRKKETLRLAFAAYGTCSPGDMSKTAPAIAYDSWNNRYLVVYRKYVDYCAYLVYAQIVTADGTPFIPEFLVGNDSFGTPPAVAYDNVNKRFLAVWRDNGGAISGRLINPDGSSAATFAVSNTVSSKQQPAVAYDGVSRRFLVVWVDWRNSSSDIYGQLVNADGTLSGTTADVNFPISTASGEQSQPKIAYDVVNQRFLVAWQDFRSLSSYDIYGQLVNADGSLFGTTATANFPISTNNSNQQFPTVAFDPVNSRYLVAWNDYRNAGDIYGQLIKADGSLFNTSATDNFPLSPIHGNQWSSTVTYDDATGNFLIVWMDGATSTFTGQLIQPDGNPVGGTFAVTGSTGNSGSTQAVAYNSTCANFMIAFADYNGIPTDISLARVGAACSWTLTAAKTGTGSGTVASAPAGINCGATCSAPYTGGATVTLTATPDAGSYFTGWGDGCAAGGAVSPYNVTVSANLNCTANFTLNSYTVTPSAGSNGSISPNSGQTVNYNATASFTVTPAVGYRIASVTGCGGSLSGSTYTTGNITGTCNVSATFTPNTYTITSNAGTDGTITPSGPVSVTPGSSSSFTINPSTGYYISDVLVDGASVGAVTSYTFQNVTANHTIQVIYALPDGHLATKSTESVSIADALVAMQIAIGAITPTAEQLKHGDVAPLVNGKRAPNGRIDLGDAVVLLRRAVGLVDVW